MNFSRDISVVGLSGVTLIIPTRNEEDNIVRVLDSVPECVSQVIVVDGNSTDGTARRAESHPRVDLVLRQKSSGKGAALSLGFSHTRFEYVVTVDGDGSMDLSLIPNFVAALDRGAELVRGSRFMQGGGSDDITAFRKFGNDFLTQLANLLYGGKWTDLEYGFTATTLSVLRQIDVMHFDNMGPGRWTRLAYGQGFEIESLLHCRCSRQGLRIVEIPAFETKRWSGSSNLRAIPDGVRALTSIVVERLRPR